jgi:hypothetical protein
MQSKPNVVLELDPIPLYVPGACVGELVIRVVDEHHRIIPSRRLGGEDDFDIEVFPEPGSRS